jgi:hypothetical protein
LVACGGHATDRAVLSGAAGANRASGPTNKSPAPGAGGA